MLQDATRTALSLAGSRIGRPVVVDSFGRSGSTLIHDAVCQAASRIGDIGRRAVSGAAWRLDTDPLRRGRCYKSHDYPPSSNRADVIYVFGDPVDATVSAIDRARREPGWLDEHCEHMGVPRCSPDDLMVRDALRIGDHFRAWRDQRVVPMCMVRYELLWEKVEALSGFVGFNVPLPERRGRNRHGLSEAEISRVRETYSGLALEIELSVDLHMTTAG